MSGPKRQRLSKEKGKNVHKSGKQSLTFSPTLATLLRDFLGHKKMAK